MNILFMLKSQVHRLLWFIVQVVLNVLFRIKMENDCVFSQDRVYRYVLKHSWRDIFDDVEKSIVWIALNPSTADESQLDPTLTRIRNFSNQFGYNCFYMLNIFAFRSTDPKNMLNYKQPIGKDNDYWIKQICNKTDKIVCCWGNIGKHLNRSDQVRQLLKNHPLFYLDMSKENQPKHPLYLSSKLELKRYYT